MGSSQKYSLKWNDFSMNVATTFRDLHSRHDFVDVTLACSDGSTLEAHKVILSSVSSYFRDILKGTPAKHPIIILKDTGRDEAQAMLEFAYTGEVNVAQDLLPTLLNTAKAYRIKGLDKVESPVGLNGGPEGGPGAAPPAEHWGSSNGGPESAPPTRPHSPVSSVHEAAAAAAASTTAAAKTEHFLAAVSAVTQRNAAAVAAAAAAAQQHDNKTFLLNRDNSHPNSSSPPSLPNSQPPTREASPAPPGVAALGPNARTPPPKRWKRSFDMTHPINRTSAPSNSTQSTEPLPLIAEKYLQQHHRGGDFENGHAAKRFCDVPNGGSAAVDVSNGDSNGSGGPSPSRPAINGQRPVLHYSQSMPTSPTMLDRQNDRLALFRHHLAANDLSRSSGDAASKGAGPSAAPPAASSTDNAIDYRCYPQQPKQEPEEYRANGGGGADFRRGSLGAVAASAAAFRPESAPTVMDMSPEGSLSGPPSVSTRDQDEVVHGHFHGEENGTDYKGYSLTPDAMGRYSCDECGKIFKHPGSLQHHRHIHRGTHRCPSCGKVFSRRWDMERHLNKSKYGCPANRFSTGSSGSSSGGSAGGGGAPPVAAVTVSQTPGLPAPPPLPAITSAVSTAAAQLEMLAAASSAASAAAAAREAGRIPVAAVPVSSVAAAVSAAVVAANNAHNTTV